MNRRLKIVMSLAVILLFSSNMINIAFAYSTPVTTANDGQSTQDNVIDNGTYFFLFYVDTTTGFIYYKSSLDGVAWNAAQGATIVSVGNVAYPFAVYNKGNKVYLAYQTAANNLIVRNGTISGDLINWDNTNDFGNRGTPLFMGGFFETDNYIWLLSHDLSAGFYRFSTWSTPISATTNLWTNRVNQQTVDTVNPGFVQGFRGAKVPWYSDGYVVIAGQYVTNYYYRIYNFSSLINQGTIGTKANLASQINQFDVEYWDDEIFFTYRNTVNYDTWYSKTNSSVSWSAPTALVVGTTASPDFTRGNNKLYLITNIFSPTYYQLSRLNYTYSTGWSSNQTLDTFPYILDTFINTPKNPNSTRIGISFFTTGNPHNIYFWAFAQDEPPAPPSPPPTEGYIGGLPNSTSVNIDGKISYIYVANIQKSIYINYTYANLINYSNTYASDVWITTSLYSTSNANPISSVNPLVLIWQNTTLIHNGTTNRPIINYPRLNTKDAQYIAIALSATEDITINASSTTQTMYSYPVYAPYSIEYLNNASNKLGIYFLWSVKVPDSYQNFTKVTPEVRFDIIKGMNSLFISMAIPIGLGWAASFFAVIIGMIIFLYKAKSNFDMDYAKLPIIFVGVLIFGVIATFSLIGGLPFEVLILSVLVSVGLYVGVILRLVMGGKKE